MPGGSMGPAPGPGGMPGPGPYIRYGGIGIFIPFCRPEKVPPFLPRGPGPGIIIIGGGGPKPPGPGGP